MKGDDAIRVLSPAALSTGPGMRDVRSFVRVLKEKRQCTVQP